MVQIGILTISDRSAQGIYKDSSGPLIAKIIDDRTGWTIVEQKIVGDEIDDIVEILESWVEKKLDLVLTSGGTGFAPRDVTPEATMQVIDRLAPGITEAMRLEGLKITPHAMLSRSVAGMKGNTLIINLPGSPKAVKENMNVVLPVLGHAIELLSGQASAESGHRII
jgi:molybdenum cofactor synthesis domain-containing protein